MAQWKQKIDITNEWKSLSNAVENGNQGELNKALKAFRDKLERYAGKLKDEGSQYELMAIIDNFDSVGSDIEEFDGVMDELYDWADYYKVWLQK